MHPLTIKRCLMINNVVVIGGINFDILSKTNQKYIEKTSNPSSISFSTGGVAKNIAEFLSGLKIETTLLGVVGKDIFGKYILNELSIKNININHIKLSDINSSGIYLSALNIKNNLIGAFSDMNIIDEINCDYIQSNFEIIKKSNFVCIDTNLQLDILIYIINILNDCKINFIIDVVSIEKSKKIYNIKNYIQYIKFNKDEFEIFFKINLDNLEDNLEVLFEIIPNNMKNVIITLGEKGIIYINNIDKTYIKLNPPKTRIKNANGAGDSLVAGFVYGLINNFEIEKSLKYGMLCAKASLESNNTIAENISAEEIDQLYKEW